MRLRPTPTCLLLLAVLAIGGCRTRLPVDPVPTAQIAERTAPGAQQGTSGLTAFLHGGESAERRSNDPMRPFLAGVQLDRLQDMVRMDRLTDHRRGPLSFLTDCACVCVPGQDH